MTDKLKAILTSDRNEIVPHLSWDDYKAAVGLNPSSIVNAEVSMLHVQHALHGGNTDSPSKQVGRGVHAALFQAGEFLSMFELPPLKEDGTYAKRTKNVVAEAADRGVELLLPDDYDKCVVLAHRASKCKELAPFIRKGQSEVSLFVRDGDCQCKGRLDWISADPLAIIDLKTATRLSEHAFRNDYAKYHYHVKLGLYQRWLSKRLNVEPIPVYLILAETRAPFDVMMAPWIDGQLIPLRQSELDYGAEKGLEWIAEIRAAIESGEWPGRAAKGNLDVSLPTWAMSNEEELQEFEG